jgi:hypothetical protein
MRRRVCAVALLALLAPIGAASAARCTVTGTAAVCVAAKTTAPYRSVAVANDSATDTIGVTDDGSAPVIGNAGTYAIPPGMTRQWGMANTVYIGPFTMISSGTSTPVTYTAE